jgi:hypothetical protein
LYHVELRHRATLGDDAFEAPWQAGRALTWELAADEALAALTLSAQSAQSVDRPGVRDH